MDLSMEQKIDKALAKIEGHENVCAVRYENIENILEERGTRLERLEDKVDGLYKTVIGCSLAPIVVVVGLMQFI
jgi:hypothetical protein